MEMFLKNLVFIRDMKKLILLLMVLLLIVACDPVEIEPEVEEVEVEEGSICDSYTTDYIQQKCYATEAEDMEMCREITYSAHKEDCVIIVAELTDDASQDCSISDVETNQIMCEALLAKNPDICLTIPEGFGNALTARDCITLVARKMRDTGVCDYYSSHSQALYDICGHTQDCEGQFLESLMIQDNIEGCVNSVEVAMSYD
jgi:hypothetical protein